MYVFMYVYGACPPLALVLDSRYFLLKHTKRVAMTLAHFLTSPPSLNADGLMHDKDRDDIDAEDSDDN